MKIMQKIFFHFFSKKFIFFSKKMKKSARFFYYEKNIKYIHYINNTKNKIY
jgi:hypothetical protein